MIRYPLFYPSINKEEILKEISKTLDTKFIGEGPRTKEFTELVADYLNDFFPAVEKKVIFVNSGTAALHLAYILADIKDGDEVITPVLTCTATQHPLLWLRAVPVFADIQEDTLNIDPKDIKRKITKKTKAIIVMHNGGQPCDMDEIMSIAKEHNLKVIEDGAQAMGGEYKNEKLGTIGDFGIFSLQAIKNLSVGDGGLLICKDPDQYDRANRLKWFSIEREKKQKNFWQPYSPFSQRTMTFDVSETGYKYQATDIDASIGIAQFKDFQKNLDVRKKYSEIYRKELKDIPSITLLRYDEGHANWLFQILVKDRLLFQRKLGKKQIETNATQIRNDIYTVFKKYSNSCPMMDKLQDNYVSIPLHPRLTEQDIYDICKIIKEVIQ